MDRAIVLANNETPTLGPKPTEKDRSNVGPAVKSADETPTPGPKPAEKDRSNVGPAVKSADETPTPGPKPAEKDRSNVGPAVKSADVWPAGHNGPKIDRFRMQKLLLEHVVNRIPRRITGLDEIYVRHCLERIRINGSRAKRVEFSLESFGATIVSGITVCSHGDQVLGPIGGSPSLSPTSVSNGPVAARFDVSNEDIGQRSFFGPQNERLPFEDRRFGSEQPHKTAAAAYRRGTLRCSWENGLPCHLFSAESPMEAYTAGLGSDRVYAFRRKDSGLAAEMSVCSSFAVCPHGTGTVETRFVLRTAGGGGASHRTRRTKKVIDVLRQRTCSGFDGSVAVRKHSSRQGAVAPESPGVELCAVVVKERVLEAGIGGWGLKFLRAGGCSKGGGNGGCRSTGIDVVVPAGFHGEARSGGGGGPSGLVERWSSGSCDCGGWDLGCPLTVLRPTWNNNGSFDLSVQGCKQNIQVLKMEQIHEGLYEIQYKSTLSTLQTFSIVVAKIHSNSKGLSSI